MTDAPDAPDETYAGEHVDDAVEIDPDEQRLVAESADTEASDPDEDDGSVPEDE